MAANLYAPPSAKVSDIASVSDEVQEIRLWSAKGRVGRLRYLAYSVGASLVMGVLGMTAMVIFGPTAGGVVYAVLYIPFLIFAVLTGIKRSHDMNWSGWTLLLPFVSAIGMSVIAATLDPNNPNNSSRLIVILLAFGLSLSGLIWVFKKGTEGSNDYGAPPPPNTTGVKILAYTFPAIFVIGILAAIALPAYQQYVQRAQEAQQGK